MKKRGTTRGQMERGMRVEKGEYIDAPTGLSVCLTVLEVRTRCVNLNSHKSLGFITLSNGFIIVAIFTVSLRFSLPYDTVSCTSTIDPLRL